MSDLVLDKLVDKNNIDRAKVDPNVAADMFIVYRSR